MMNNRPFKTLDQLKDFLSATEQIEFSFNAKADRYQFILDHLIQFNYNTLSKVDKGLLLRFLSHVCGYSHVQIKRLAAHYVRVGTLPHKPKPRASTIGERRKPNPNGQPGYIRVDTVHQGDLDKVKGVYYINVVDEITQFEIVCSTEKISEAYLVPILKQLIDQFPFKVLGFHADNGSEYINHTLARLLNKLLIEFTKSRPRRSNDNALVETKNGAIVRKYFGYAHISQHWAPDINHFCMQYLNPYLNYHRPCFFPETKINDKGKQVKLYHYKNMMTPYDKFKSLEQANQFLKPKFTFKQLDEIAYSICDNEAALRMNKAKKQLFKLIFERKHQVA